MAVDLMKETKLPCLTLFLCRLSRRWPLTLEDFVRIHEDIFQSITYGCITFKGPGTSPSLGVVPSVPLPVVAVTIIIVVTWLTTTLILISNIYFNFPRAVTHLLNGDIALDFLLISRFSLSVSIYLFPA